MADRIVWKDLDKKVGIFTKRNATMVDLSNGAVVQHYGANTKINVVQETTIDDAKYFRTETAAGRNLDWAFKASDFELPPELASLEPSDKPLNNNFSIISNPYTSLNKNSSKMPKATKSEVVVLEEKKLSILSAFKRFFRRKK